MPSRYNTLWECRHLCGKIRTSSGSKYDYRGVIGKYLGEYSGVDNDALKDQVQAVDLRPLSEAGQFDHVCLCLTRLR